jgi:hypothetical protein
MTPSEQRQKWRDAKRAQRRKNPEADAQKRREKYLLNREAVLERQRRYYHTTWKLRAAGYTP